MYFLFNKSFYVFYRVIYLRYATKKFEILKLIGQYGLESSFCRIRNTRADQFLFFFFLISIRSNYCLERNLRITYINFLQLASVTRSCSSISNHSALSFKIVLLKKKFFFFFSVVRMKNEISR